MWGSFGAGTILHRRSRLKLSSISTSETGCVSHSGVTFEAYFLFHSFKAKTRDTREFFYSPLNPQILFHANIDQNGRNNTFVPDG
jgi:hypothetical protein